MIVPLIWNTKSKSMNVLLISFVFFEPKILKMRKIFILFCFSLITFNISAQSIPASIPKTGLVAWYPFNGNAKDESGNGNNGTVFGATLVPDRFGNANSGYNFNGVSNYIEVPDTAPLNPPKSISISVWIKTTAVQGNAGILGKWNNFGGIVGVGREQYVLQASDADHGVNFGIRTSGYATVFANEPTIKYNNGNWNHLVGIWDGSNIFLYENNVLISEMQCTGTMRSIGQGLEIGRYAGGQPTCATNYYYIGNIDDVAIWNRALTRQEVSVLFNGCPGFPEAKLTIRGDTTFCQGSLVKLSTKADTGFTYQWFRNDTLITNATDSIYNAVKTGNYAVMIEKNSCTSMSKRVQVTVNPVPSSTISVSGPTTFCAGSTVTLSVASNANTSYLWSNGTASPSLTVDKSGTFSVTTSSKGCVSTSQPLSVVVKPNPVAKITPSGITSFCDGGSVTLTASGGDAYSWNTGDMASVINISSTGNYSVTAITNGCSATATQSVLVNPLPVASFTTVTSFTELNSGAIALTGSPAGGTFTGSGISGNLFNPLKAGLGKKTLRYSFTDTKGCSSFFRQTTVVYDTTGVHCTVYDTTHVTRYTSVTDTLFIKAVFTGSNLLTGTNIIKIYPNPAKTHLNILFTDAGRQNGYSVQIKNLLSQVVFESVSNQQMYTILLESWVKKGVYFVHVRNKQGETVEIKKIILQ
jgi:hypothetical protein